MGKSVVYSVFDDDWKLEVEEKVQKDLDLNKEIEVSEIVKNNKTGGGDGIVSAT